MMVPTHWSKERSRPRVHRFPQRTKTRRRNRQPAQVKVTSSHPSRVWKEYERANAYIDDELIRRGPVLPSHPWTRQQWMAHTLSHLGDPQRAFPSIHVAGTSGKGSVCVMLAEILHAAGIRTGMHLSPYLQVATEKLWSDGQLASAHEYAELVEWLSSELESPRHPCMPAHGVASVALCLEYFRRKQVELAVVEAGVGGRHDLTNVLNTQIAVLTGLGADHLQTLGPRLADIAWHKAGIIQSGSRAVVFDDGRSGLLVKAARHQADRVGADLKVVNHSMMSSQLDGDRMRVCYAGPVLTVEDALLGLRGTFQPTNAALAIATAETLIESGFAIEVDHIRTGLQRARLAGRWEHMPDLNCRVIVDGAHNQQKIAAALNTVESTTSFRSLEASRHGRHETGSRDLVLVIGMLASKTFPTAELSRLVRSASHVVITEPQVFGKSPMPGNEIVARLPPRERQARHVEPDPRKAMEAARQCANSDTTIIVTGSLYLAGNIREMYYPSANVLAERTCWPSMR